MVRLEIARRESQYSAIRLSGSPEAVNLAYSAWTRAGWRFRRIERATWRKMKLQAIERAAGM